MDNKIVALIIIVLLIVIGGFYLFSTQISANNNSTINNTNNNTQLNTSHTGSVNTIKTNNKTNNTNQNSTTKVKISPKQAQINAVGAEKELTGNDVFAGTPKLFKWTINNKHTWVYNVNLYDVKTKKSVGALYVDAMNGEIIMNE